MHSSSCEDWKGNTGLEFVVRTQERLAVLEGSGYPLGNIQGRLGVYMPA